MLAVFEVYLVDGKSSRNLLSAEQLRETGAKVMTLEEATKEGFAGLHPLSDAGELRLISVSRRDAPWIQRSLEAHDAVASFRVHDVDWAASSR
jgi:hypothetical protein